MQDRLLGFLTIKWLCCTGLLESTWSVSQHYSPIGSSAGGGEWRCLHDRMYCLLPGQSGEGISICRTGEVE